MAMGIQPEELIAEYCDLEKIAKALHRGSHADASAEIDSAVRAMMQEEPGEKKVGFRLDRRSVSFAFIIRQMETFPIIRPQIKCFDTEVIRLFP